VAATKVSTIWFYPNFDAGSETISQELRKLSAANSSGKIHFSRYLPPEIFSWLLSKTRCFIGNSSAGIKECSYLGVPVVNVGDRQSGRTKAKNVVSVGFQAKGLQKALSQQLGVKRYPKDKTYYVKGTSKKIADKLATLKLYVQKRFVD
jgi:UDP-N-acetylglucosamine 2-epimerase